MDPLALEVFLAKYRLHEEDASDVDAFVAWGATRFPDAPRLQLLAGYRPITEDLDHAFVAPALEEAGLVLPEALDALRTLAFHEMRAIVSDEISPEEGAGNIDQYVYGSGVDHEAVSAVPALWNFCVYRRYLRAAGDADDSTWYGQVMDDIRAEAEYHLGLRAQPPAERTAPAEVPAEATPGPVRAFSPNDVLAAARSGVDLYELYGEAGSLAPALAPRSKTGDELYALGYAYAHGTGVARNLAMAADCYRKAGELGHASALNNLGCLYDTGSGVPADRAMAVHFWQQAAERGSSYAMCSLGAAYNSGYGLPQDHQAAIALYRRSADGGCPAGHTNLGLYYRDGEHLPRDYQQAAACFRRGAEMGDARAQYELGKLYQDGLGMATNHERAAVWFRQAYETQSRKKL